MVFYHSKIYLLPDSGEAVHVWPQNKGHGKSVSYKTDVGTDLRRAHFKKSALHFEAAKGSRKNLALKSMKKWLIFLFGA